MKDNFYPAPNASPYLKKSQLYDIKDYHLNVLKILKEKKFKIKNHSLIDIGCGNGSLLNTIISKIGGETSDNIYGIDATKEYIDFANKKKNYEINFRHANLSDVLEVLSFKKFDFVISTGVLPIFSNFEEFFDGCISVLKPGGILIVNGRINPEPVDVRMQFRDFSHKDTDSWRSDWNVHSEYSILKKYSSSFSEVEFIEDELYTEIPYDKNKPAVSTKTFKNLNNEIIQTNGALIIKNYRFFIGKLNG